MFEFSHREKWQRFRAEVIELDGGNCVRCKRGTDIGIVLQVHHKEYITNRNLWDYPYELCETLCKGCHAAEHGIIAPKTGWKLIGFDDLEDLTGTCELCGTMIRYVFFIHHPKWLPLEVGETCCDYLTETELASNHLESIKRYFARRERFSISKRWIRHADMFLISQKGIQISIRASGSGFQLFLNGYAGEKRFDTVIEAKLFAFEVIENGKAEGYLSKKPRLWGRQDG